MNSPSPSHYSIDRHNSLYSFEIIVGTQIEAIFEHMIFLRREFEFLQKISCNCHNVHGSAISRNFLRRMNGARIICFKQKCYTFQKNVHTYVKCPFEIEFFLLPFFWKKKTFHWNFHNYRNRICSLHFFWKIGKKVKWF